MLQRSRRFHHGRLVLMCGCSLAVQSHGHAQCQYEVTILPTPGTGTSRAISDTPDVAGWYNIPPSEFHHAFGWNAEVGVFNLPFLPIYADNRAYAVNDLGHMAGTMGGYFTESRAFFYDGSQVINLGTMPGGNFSEGLSLNNSGRVVGYWGDMVDGDPAAWSAFVWEDGRMTDLGAILGRPYSKATDVNQAGQVTGLMAYEIFEDARAYIWNDGALTEIPTPPGGYSNWGFAINDAGDVVGKCYVAPAVWHAFLWADGQATDLGTLPGYQRSLPRDVNDLRQVVGFCDSFPPPPGGNMAFLWQNGQMFRLDDLVPSNFHITIAEGINDAGQIAAHGSQGALLLTPIRPAGDLNLDCTVGIVDMLMLLGSWGPCAQCGACIADLDGDCVVGVTDFLALLGQWG